MQIINGSRYPDGAILRLVRFAFSGIPAGGVGVYVGDHPDVGRGLTYNGLPKLRGRCPFSSSDGVRRYVSLEIGAPHRFPATNMVSRVVSTRQVPLTDDILFDERGQPRSGRDAAAYLSGLIGEHERLYKVDHRGRHVVVATYRYGPYGGRGSVLYSYEDWQEGVLAYAAHEARHVHQFVRRDAELRRHGKVRTRLSEGDAERYALGVLTRFRRHRAAVLGSPSPAVSASPTSHGTRYAILRLLTPPERQYGPR